MLNANTAININETILTLAQKRPNIIQDARLLGYEPTQLISYVYQITITFLKSKQYYIPHLTEFTQNGNSYYYMGQDIDINANAGDTIDIQIKEGTLISYKNEPQNLTQVIANQQYLDIPYQNVEENGIEVFVTYYQPNGTLTQHTEYFKSNTLLIDINDNLTKKFVRLENIEMQTPRIYFTLSNVGNPLPEGAIVDMNILQSKGPNGAMSSTPALPPAKGTIIDAPQTTIQDIKISNTTLLIRGNDVESNQSIQENAPVLYNTASRCVTANDYEVICKKQGVCKEAFVFGGEDEHPIKLGNIYFSLTPEKASRTFINNADNTYWYRDNLDSITNNYLLPDEIMSKKVNINGDIINPGILDIIKMYNLPALQYNIRNPIYVLIDFNIKVVKYTLSSVHVKTRQNIFNIVSNFILALEQFSTEFFESNIIKKINEYLTDVTGIELSSNFSIMIDSYSVSTEETQLIENNKIINKAVDAIHIYLDTPYEGIYNNEKKLIISALPSINTDNIFNDSSNNISLEVDFSDNNVITNPAQKINTPINLTSDLKYIQFPINITYKKTTTEIGNYIIYNDRTTYIKITINTGIKISQSESLNDLLNASTGFLTLKYPSNNMQTIRNSIFKLNTVSII